jgi:hypothetical protein
VLALGVKALETLILRNIDENTPESNPRKVAEPNFGKLCESYIGDVSFWLDVKDKTDNIVSTEKLGLDDLQLQALDLLYIQNSELEMRLKYCGKKRGHNKFDIRYEKSSSIEDDEETTETKSFSDLQFLIKALQETIVQGQPLRYSDFISPQETLKEEVLIDSVKEVFQRYYDILVLFVKTIRELESLNDNAETEEQSLENKRTTLMKASLFGLEYAIPIDIKGNIITSIEELNSRITITIRELKSRVPQYDSLVQTLSEWKSIHETQGEQKLLESVSNQLSGGGSDNKMKYHKTLEILIGQIRSILNNNSFLVLAPFTNPSDFLASLRSSVTINRKALKWIEKATYVRPRLKLFDDIVTYNQIFESSYFSFYYDETKFMQSAETLSSSLDKNLTSTVVVISTKAGEPESFPSDPSKKLVGLVIDEWTEKIVSKTQDTSISFHYDGPSTEAPQSLLLAVLPNDSHIWNKNTLRTVIQETLRLAKLRAIDYRSMKELRQFLPLANLNSHGGDIYINLYEPEGETG